MPMNDKLAVMAVSDRSQGPFVLTDSSGPFYAPGGDELADATGGQQSRNGGARRDTGERGMGKFLPSF